MKKQFNLAKVRVILRRINYRPRTFTINDVQNGMNIEFSKHPIVETPKIEVKPIEKENEKDKEKEPIEKKEEIKVETNPDDELCRRVVKNLEGDPSYYEKNKPPEEPKKEKRTVKKTEVTKPKHRYKTVNHVRKYLTYKKIFGTAPKPHKPRRKKGEIPLSMVVPDVILAKPKIKRTVKVKPKPKVKTTTKSKTKSTTKRKPNQKFTEWREKLAKYRKEHPEKTYKQCMIDLSKKNKK
jgi:hypothetical protein